MSADYTLTLTMQREGARDIVELPTLLAVARTPGVKPREATLSLDVLRVGSSPDCGLVFDDPSVSRYHATLQLTERGVRVRDLDSKNGTKVDGAQLSDGWVLPGAELTLGNSRLLLKQKRGAVRVELSGVRFGSAFGESRVMRALFARLEQVAQTDSPLLLLGESGTGKELLARGVHERSGRARGPFVVLDCAALSPALLESELFGHEEGAFTGAGSAAIGLVEQAHGGTLFLDEVGELPLELQPRLLRAMEEKQVRPLGGRAPRPVDVRIIAATHRDLHTRMVEGEFRKDLYYRLAVMEAFVPPLRERKEDLPGLVRHFFATHSPPLSLEELPENTLALLLGHHWPGNIRELRNTCLQLAVFRDPGMLAVPQRPRLPSPANFAHLPWREARNEAMAFFERTFLEDVLKAHSGNVSGAARALGISRQLAHRLILRYGLKAREEDGPGGK